MQPFRSLMASDMNVSEQWGMAVLICASQTSGANSETSTTIPMPHFPTLGLRTPLFGISLVLLMATACDPEAGAEADGSHLEPEVEELYRVGSVEGGRLDSFSRVTSVAFDDQGRLYVLDADARQVIVVGRDGLPTARFGSHGDGPGQFRSVQAMAVLPTGEVAVADGLAGALLLFSPDGNHLRTVRFSDGPAGGANLLFPDPSGASVLFASRGIVMSQRGGGPPSFPTDIPIQRLVLSGPDEGELSVVHRAWRPTRDAPGGLQVRSQGGQVQFSGAGPGMVAFEPQLHLTALPDGRFAVADSSTYRIRIHAPDGEHLDSVERPVMPRPVGEREQEAERDRRMRDLQEGGGPQIQMVVGGPGGGTRAVDQSDMREMFEEQIRNLRFWPEIPVIQALAADREGRLWVRRSSGAGAGPGPMDLLSAEGELLGTIPAGELSLPHAFGPDGLVAWIEPDELEVPFVRVARLSGLP